MKAEKRVNKGYKIKDSIYQKALRKAERNKTPLASLIEQFIIDYARPVKKDAVIIEKLTAARLYIQK